eukprot:2211598-Rhodomonas_salina.1
MRVVAERAREQESERARERESERARTKADLCNSKYRLQRSALPCHSIITAWGNGCSEQKAPQRKEVDEEERPRIP